MTAEEHLRQDVGAILTQLLFQNAILKAEADRLRESSNGKGFDESPGLAGTQGMGSSPRSAG